MNEIIFLGMALQSAINGTIMLFDMFKPTWLQQYILAVLFTVTAIAIKLGG